MPAPASRATTFAQPEGWVTDPLTQQQLAVTLGRAGPGVAGVIAKRTDAPPGSSYRVVAERRALGLSQCSPTSDLEVDGAVLLRSGVTFELRDGAVLVERGDLLVDHATSTHDPWRPLDEVTAATPDGRPPFSHRPLVMFLGLDPDLDRADWARRSVNDLVRRSTEGRIAVPHPTGGLHLTGPCAPVQASITALRPDVVIALDPAALEVATQWSGTDRSAIHIELTQDTTDRVELVSWQIGRAQGRLRARIGRGIGAAALEDLVRRLCAGPQPLPPDLSSQGGLRIRPTRRAKRHAPSVVAIIGAPPSSRAGRYEALAEHLSSAGSRMDLIRMEHTVPEAAHTADIVMVGGLSASGAVQHLADARRASGRTTVIDLGPQDVRPSGRAEHAVVVSVDALRLVRTAGAATTTSQKVQESLATSDIRCLVLPTLLSEARSTGLRLLREGHRDTGAPVLGWHTGAAGDPGEDRETIPLAIAELLDRRPELSVELVGHRTHLVGALAQHPRVMIAPGEPHTRSIVRWRTQVWAPLAAQAIGGGDFRSVVDAQHLGVPTVVASASQPALEGLVPRDLTVDGTEASVRVVSLLLDDDRSRQQWSSAVVRLAASLDSAASSASVASRFLGWSISGDRA